MLRAAALLVLVVLPGAAQLTIDHVTIAGKDLKALEAGLAAAGLRSEYGGPHENHATEMALTSFPDGSYIELIAIQPHADAAAVAAHAWAKWMEGGAGPCAWAVRVKNLDGEFQRLQAAGVAVGAPVRGGRQRPDGTPLEWETAQVGQEPGGTFFPFLIRDLTPRRQRAFPGGKPTTTEFTGVTRVVIAVRNLADGVKRYRAAYGLPEPIRQVDPDFGAQLALMGSATVVLAAPLNAESWLWARLERFGEGPCAFLVGARKPGAWPVTARGRWFGSDISWLDPATLGWRLGLEAARQ